MTRKSRAAPSVWKDVRTSGSLFAAAAGVGAALLLGKVWVAFSTWVLPELVEVANVVFLVGALVVLASLAWRRARLTGAAAVSFALAVPMLDLVVVRVVAESRVRDAKAYCESFGAGATRSAPPVLYRPGYSARYAARCDASGGRFPDPFPGRTFWEGERRSDGSWTWEHLMD